MRRWGFAEGEGEGEGQAVLRYQGRTGNKGPLGAGHSFASHGSQSQVPLGKRRLWMTSGVVVGLRRVVKCGRLPWSHRPTRMSAIFSLHRGIAPPAQGDEGEQGCNKVTRDRLGRAGVVWEAIPRLGRVSVKASEIDQDHLNRKRTPLPPSRLCACGPGGRFEEGWGHRRRGVSIDRACLFRAVPRRRGSRLVGDAETSQHNVRPMRSVPM